MAIKSITKDDTQILIDLTVALRRDREINEKVAWVMTEMVRLLRKVKLSPNDLNQFQSLVDQLNEPIRALGDNREKLGNVVEKIGKERWWGNWPEN